MTVDIHLWADSILIRALTVLIILTLLYITIIYLADHFVIKTYPFITTPSSSSIDNEIEDSPSLQNSPRSLRLRKEAFYIQYNNSSQFLRRDSFAVNEF
ncbi:hypothetical protein CORT_0C05105 [Candida orthopsilosis Co 90-125]|uniref:Uncharacterized protein n=1 Tax=Candida orthopsilosis (strain 90-125) TaxID=1136231 RepID=H8X324_CANO9|nr:hypothetical protein CORT_0C05105 [Candida orthopsilosis Co 90-125]CCG25884.1 hypothetical protein CORT_0C05105 [Candida orthopsilosis Co 90-125]